MKQRLVRNPTKLSLKRFVIIRGGGSNRWKRRTSWQFARLKKQPKSSKRIRKARRDHYMA